MSDKKLLTARKSIFFRFLWTKMDTNQSKFIESKNNLNCTCKPSLPVYVTTLNWIGWHISEKKLLTVRKRFFLDFCGQKWPPISQNLLNKNNFMCTCKPLLPVYVTTLNWIRWHISEKKLLTSRKKTFFFFRF